MRASNTSSVSSAANEFVLVFGMILLLLGSIGNFLTMLVIACYRSMRTSSRLLFFSLAAFDQATLLVAETRYWMIAFSGWDLRTHSSAICKTHTFFTYVFMSQSRWLLTLISLERMFLTFFPLRSHLFSRSKHVLLAIAVIALLNCGKNSFYFSLELEERKCGNFTFGNSFVFEVSDLILSCLLPFFITLTATLMVLWKVFRPKHQLAPRSFQQSESTARLKSTTAMLVGVVVLRFFFGLPGYIYTVLSQVKALAEAGDQVLLSLGTSLLTLTVMDNAANFFVYLLSARGFRRTFFDLCRAAMDGVTKRCRCGSQN